MKLTSDGQIDTSFGFQGTAILSPDSRGVDAMAIDSSELLYVADEAVDLGFRLFRVRVHP